MSRSNTEELIGILWLILTVLLHQNGIKYWWVATLILGVLCQVCSITFAVKGKLKAAIAKQKTSRSSLND